MWLCPARAALKAIDGMREVYGIRGVKFNEAGAHGAGGI